jgi:hypothetical protein
MAGANKLYKDRIDHLEKQLRIKDRAIHDLNVDLDNAKKNALSRVKDLEIRLHQLQIRNLWQRIINKL